ncbi:hypothetical protein BDV95DRAFT_591853 [Massariosphaeria phaeospora]|uniref:WSC domain-containing protein n=1 Tax=Massariosphaeria phaeospora TaxID=100035 RepID=A0A7C8MGX9_9PLEO|nr:hypothetical protein BDV95DRAFT_591853 [Massariosphaeria phaeospora]
MAHTRSALHGLVALLALLLFVGLPVSAIAAGVSYCSSQNTGADSAKLHHTWQSNGWCTDQCTAKGAAFAVILTEDCWCSNYIPEEQASTSDCNDNCPGFPTEKCGNKDEGLYIYLKLGGKPSGTMGGSKPTSAPVSTNPPAAPSSSTSTRPPPSSQILTSEKPAPSAFETSPATSPATSAPAPSSDEPPAKGPQTSQPPPVTSIQIVTVSGGGIVTQTVISTPKPVTVPEEPKKPSNNVGGIVGGVLGGIAAFAAIGAGVFFLLRRRQRQQQAQEDHEQRGVHRNTSTMSKNGLLGATMTHHLKTDTPARHSRVLDADSISPVSGPNRRNSGAIVFDQRLNPSAIMTLDNASQGSFGSLDDSRDYGRTLNVRNPDPDRK